MKFGPIVRHSPAGGLASRIPLRRIQLVFFAALVVGDSRRHSRKHARSPEPGRHRSRAQGGGLGRSRPGRGAGARAADRAATAPDASGRGGRRRQRAQGGQLGPVVDWPVVGVHVALLPNGKVLAYDSVGDTATETYPVHDHTRATVWDPATGTQTPVNVTPASTSSAAAWLT